MVRELRFADLADGSVQVTDAASGQEIQRIAAGGHGFVRATLRGLARARRARGVGQTVPFRLELRESGQLLLLDPATGQAIDLWAFGATNAEAFASMLGADSQPLASLALTAAPSRP
jgi:putative photosynthetic complex assembly protein